MICSRKIFVGFYILLKNQSTYLLLYIISIKSIFVCYIKPLNISSLILFIRLSVDFRGVTISPSGMYTNFGCNGFNTPPSNCSTFPSLYNSFTSFNSNLMSFIHVNPKSFSYIFESIVGIFQLGTSTFSFIAGFTLCNLLSVLVNVPNVLAKLVAGSTTSAPIAVFVI